MIADNYNPEGTLTPHYCHNGHTWEAVLRRETLGWFYVDPEARYCPECGVEGEYEKEAAKEVKPLYFTDLTRRLLTYLHWKLDYDRRKILRNPWNKGQYLSKLELCRRTGIPWVMLWEYLTGRTAIPYERLDRILHALGISVLDLIHPREWGYRTPRPRIMSTETSVKRRLKARYEELNQIQERCEQEGKRGPLDSKHWQKFHKRIPIK